MFFETIDQNEVAITFNAEDLFLLAGALALVPPTFAGTNADKWTALQAMCTAFSALFFAVENMPEAGAAQTPLQNGGES